MRCPDCDKAVTFDERVSGMCSRCWCLLPDEMVGDVDAKP